MRVSRAPIWCLGGAVWDRKLRLLAPLAAGSSNPVAESSAPGGVARNVAHNLRLLGLPVQLLSAWGDDAGGAQLQADCERLGIGVGAVLRCPGQASGSYSAVLQPDGNLLLGLAQLDALEALTPVALRRTTARRRTAPVQLADMNLRADTLTAWLTEPRQGLAVLLAVSEPKMQRLPANLAGLDLLIANAGEWQAAGGGARLARRGLRRVLVTEGARGLRCGHWQDGRWRWQRLPAPLVAELLDATGAGDALAAGVLAAWRSGVAADDLPRAARFGQQLAARALGSLHSVAPDIGPDLLKEFLDAP
ncbi:PfkB family carbohydrate kinase [Inhella sp.]|uniref:PfkB family carbohydrate kinase n=1 Tax=Inhella sp. TaxID=1921806 RepID=UPI0035B2DC8F